MELKVKIFRTVLLSLCSIALAAIAVSFALLVIDKLPWTASWDVWVVMTALGTVGATLVALVLALRAWASGRASAARLVSAWVTEEFTARSDGSAYERIAHLHIANESNEPAFQAAASVHFGRLNTPLGPLAAPSPIAVLPPRRELVFDISVPLLAHPQAVSLKASLTFFDARGKMWTRDVDGTIRNVTRKRQRWSKKPEDGDMNQLGDMTSLFNPLSVVFLFLNGLRDPDFDNEQLRSMFAEKAHGWNGVDLAALSVDLADYQPTSMVDYQAPRIARVKLSGAADLEGKNVIGEGAAIELKDVIFVTLILHPREGWKIYQVGDPVPSEKLSFGGNLTQVLEPYGPFGA